MSIRQRAMIRTPSNTAAKYLGNQPGIDCESNLSQYGQVGWKWGREFIPDRADEKPLGVF